MKKLLFGILFVLLFSTYAFSDINLDSGNFNAAYKEPTENANGTPLNDLELTTIYYSLDGGPRIKVVEIPASSPNGGGTVLQSFVINGLGDQVDVQISYTASDFSGNESESYIENIIRIDSVSPSNPQG